MLRDLWMALLFMFESAPPWYESARIILSSIFALATLTMAALMAYREFRSKSAERWENNYKAEETARKQAEEEAKKLVAQLAQRDVQLAEKDAQLAAKDVEIEKWNSKTDLSALMRQFDESRAADREFQTQMIGALTTIATSHDGRSDRVLQLIEQQSAVLAQQAERDVRALEILEGLIVSVAGIASVVERLNGHK